MTSKIVYGSHSVWCTPFSTAMPPKNHRTRGPMHYPWDCLTFYQGPNLQTDHYILSTFSNLVLTERRLHHSPTIWAVMLCPILNPTIYKPPQPNHGSFVYQLSPGCTHLWASTGILNLPLNSVSRAVALNTVLHNFKARTVFTFFLFLHCGTQLCGWGLPEDTLHCVIQRILFHTEPSHR